MKKRVFSLRENKSHSTCKRSRDYLDCFVVIFSVFISSMPFKVIIIDTVYVLENKYVLGPSQSSF